ncbi:SoxR reducing system RseC family protein [Selenomonas sp. ND2010]|jgi:sigma-E factor negative regulatory protein RseC|uniref:SoxR reducing system RseC family protein n=1 Tax=Selenomonas sp. ND2010 TaxID=1410618 RepID=UPI00051C4899|nr:SoxR reducing system RseC family protein [Selenomonas sp. ND2010]
MKQEEGLIVKVQDGMAIIKVGRHADCSACGACPSSRHVMVEAVNRIGAKPGQRVRFAMQESQVLTGAFVVFVLPLLAAAVGAVLGWQLAIGVGGEFAFWTKFGAGFFFVLSLVAIKLFDRQVAKKQRMKPVILEILED